MIVFDILWLSLIALLAVPIGALALESLAALLPARKHALTHQPRPAIDVLVPAHNEATMILATLESIRAQLTPQDRLCVVADNCCDATAAIAREAGAEVCERDDQVRRGKGYALAFGLDYLAPAARPVTIIIDADCIVDRHTIERLTTTVQSRQAPAQAAYLMYATDDDTPRDIISELAVYVKNYVRPRGLARLGAPAPLAGSGMAFPTEILRSVRLDSPNLVEDMQLGLDLLLAGHATDFCVHARVTSPLPASRAASKTQRTRWEHGHLRTLLTQVPRLLAAAVRQRRLALLVAGIDLMIPPLTLLVLLWIVLWSACLVVATVTGDQFPIVLVTLEGVVLATALILALIPNNQRRWRSLLLAGPLYMASKVSIYWLFFFRPQRAWLRTERDGQA